MLRLMAICVFIWLLLFSLTYLVMQDWVHNFILDLTRGHGDVIGSAFFASVITAFFFLSAAEKTR